MKVLQSLVLMATGVLVTGCSNLFLAHYDGKQFPRTSTATRVTQTPAESTADLIGMSTFATSLDPGNDDAIAAAEQVGADMVEWDKSYQGTKTSLELRPIFGPYTSGTSWAEGGTLVDVEQPISVKWYRYHARFYRSTN
jgi:hypothetical protein